MKRLVWALLMFVPILIFGQNKSIFFSVNSPEFIPYGKPFEIFANLKFADLRYDEVNVYLISESRIPIQEISIYNSYNLVRRRPEQSEFGGYTQSYRINLSKADTLFDFSTYFRIKFSLNSYYDDNARLNYAVEYLYNKKPVLTLTSFGRNPQLSPTLISFYRAQQIAGRCLMLQEGGELGLELNPAGEKEFPLTEFWVKLNGVKSEFFRITGSTTGDKYFSIGLNENSFVYLSDNGRDGYTGTSLSRNAWYHISLYLADGRVKLYIGKSLIYENESPKQNNDEELKLSFVNTTPDSYLYLDQLRIWDYHDDISKCFDNRQYTYFGAEHSELIYQNQFNEDIYPQETGHVKITDLNRIRIVQSDAPVISRAPEINITVFSSYCSIEWSNRDNQKPKNFIVEKSKDGNNFSEVFRTTADEDLNKIYYYSDKRDDYENITFYRVRQINYDGSEVYSASLKVGQSAKKEKIKVGQNYPNPFNPETSFAVEMPENTEALITVYDLVGKSIKVLHDGPLNKGTHTFNFNGSSLPSGIYLYEVKTPSASVIKKMILTK